MRFTHLKLENWRNFLAVDVPLEQRVFLVGPNASGKSNLLDAFRFLRDIAEPQGGLQRAVKLRGSVSQIRSLHARRYPTVAIEVEVGDNDSERWTYRLELTQNNQRVPIVAREIVRRGDTVVLERPDKDDKADSSRQTQTHLEQVNANKQFRELAELFAAVRYLHLVPQLVREPDRSKGLSKDPFGGDFLEQLARTPKKTRDSRQGIDARSRRRRRSPPARPLRALAPQSGLAARGPILRRHAPAPGTLVGVPGRKRTAPARGTRS